MANLGGFNPNDFEEVRSFDPIPEGEYRAVITDSQMIDTQDDTVFAFRGAKVRAQYLCLTFEILEGQYAHRLIWANFNLVNKNEKTVEIAERTLASCFRAVGLNRPVQNSAEAHDKQLQIKVIIKPPSVGKNGQHYKAKNEVRGFKSLGQTVPHVAATAQAQAQAPANGGVTPPWANQEQKKDGNKPLPF